MLKRCILILATVFFSTNALAQWALVNDDSELNYVSIKKSKVGEVNSFKQLEGSINSDGKLSINIDLGSVETNIPKRNERMKSMLFEIASFSKANISAALDVKTIDKMAIGETYQDSFRFNLSLHGVSQEMATDVRVVKLAKDRILAVSMNPVIVEASQYDLLEGIEKLREVANLPSISSAVPVTFSLIFKQQ
ncbi:YceI family protein [Hydrogenovibrio sp. SC-1]|nr:YceI family protein [Hydrogenovibrio sp. SC-1]